MTTKQKTRKTRKTPYRSRDPYRIDRMQLRMVPSTLTLDDPLDLSVRMFALYREERFSEAEKLRMALGRLPVNRKAGKVKLLRMSFPDPVMCPTEGTESWNERYWMDWIPGIADLSEAMALVVFAFTAGEVSAALLLYLAEGYGAAKQIFISSRRSAKAYAKFRREFKARIEKRRAASAKRRAAKKTAAAKKTPQ